MLTPRTTGRALATLAVLGLAAAQSASAQTAVVSYQFNNTLAADRSGAPALTATDPLGMNGFLTDTVFGLTRTVYHTAGNTSPLLQAGLTLDTTGLVSPNSYSVRMVTDFSDNANAWRRLVDVQNRQSDAGFYVDPSNNLDVYPVGGGGTFANNVYHDIVLTDDAGTVNAYLDGTLAFTENTTVMDINNPGNLMNFYLDNVAGGGQGEYSNANTALISLYSGALTGAQVSALYRTFPQASSAVPEPGSFALLGLGLLPLAAVARRRRVR